MSPNTTRRTYLTGASAAAMVFVAGCLGGDDDDTDDGTNGDATNGNDDTEAETTLEAGTTIVLEGHASHWEGVQPDAIAGEENPTLVLEDGGEYELEWVNGDGIVHNLAIQDGDGATVDDLKTEDVQPVGDRADPLSFTATTEMAQYVCEYHAPQQGDIVVE